MLNLGLKTARPPEAVQCVARCQVRRPVLVPEQDTVTKDAMTGRVVSVAGTGRQTAFDSVRADLRWQLLPQEPMRRLVHPWDWSAGCALPSIDRRHRAQGVAARPKRGQSYGRSGHGTMSRHRYAAHDLVIVPRGDDYLAQDAFDHSELLREVLKAFPKRKRGEKLN